MNAHDVAGIIDLYSPDCVLNDRGTGSVVRGHEELREFLIGVFAAAPDMHGTVESICVNADQVWVEWGWSGLGADPQEVHPMATFLRYDDNGRIRLATDYWRGVELG